ncbi:cytochrome P450 [Chitinophaga sp. MM2321]|uniref:cytochrome P450 n=1 Tax=Chitinophaga sp. MM2321 TaxID=3137178 RepID=UPI0032D57378
METKLNARVKTTPSFLQGAPMAIPADNPYPLYRQMQQKDRIERISSMQWVITGYEEAVALLQHPSCSHWGQDPETQTALFSGQGAMGKTLFAFSPESGLPYRKNVLHALAAKNLRFQSDAMLQQADKLLTALREQDVIDFMADYAHPYTFETISRIIGVPAGDIDKLTALAGMLHGKYLQYIVTPPTSGPALEFMEYIRSIVVYKRKHPDDDLCSALIDVAKQEKEDDSFIESMLLLLFYAGHDNMMNFLGNAVVALDQHPKTQAVLRSQPAKISGCIDELLRYDSPVQFFLLFAKDNIKLSKKTIPAGSQVLVCVGAANRDPKAFPDPDDILLDRKPAHLSYGAGAYRCIGARLAQLQASTGLTQFIAATEAYTPLQDGTRWRTYPYLQRGPDSLKLQIKWR